MYTCVNNFDASVAGGGYYCDERLKLAADIFDIVTEPTQAATDRLQIEINGTTNYFILVQPRLARPCQLVLISSIKICPFRMGGSRPPIMGKFNQTLSEMVCTSLSSKYLFSKKVFQDTLAAKVYNVYTLTLELTKP